MVKKTRYRKTKRERNLILTSEQVVGDSSRISVNYEKLPEEVQKGSIIMLDDGKKKLCVEKVVGKDIYTTVMVGGELKPRRGVNVPGAYLSIPSITEKDRADLAFGLSQGVDFIALSFVRRKEDVTLLRELLTKAGKPNLPIIVKIETQESIDNLDSILAVADGAMVARGDLAIEVPTEKVPLYQKEIIRKANMLGKPVITATQMLESMITSPVPTRAEVSDIANAIFDGTDAVMLSEESTLGEFPVEAVTMMTRIAETIEGSIENKSPRSTCLPIADAISSAVCRAAQDTGAKHIVALTESGASALMVARFKPGCQVVALTPHESTRRRVMLTSGVTAYTTSACATLDESLAFIPSFLKQEGLAEEGDVVIVTAGLRFGVAGSTNMLVAISI